MRKDLSEDMIAALKPERKRYICMDKQVPWLGIRVSPKGKKSFVMVARFNSRNPTRRALGKLTLDAARDKAREWYRSLEQGIDPKRSKSKVFGDVAEDWFKRIKHQRRAHDAERIVRKRLKDWWSKPIASITKQDVIDATKAVTSKGTMCAAHQLLSHTRRLFNYSVDEEIIEHSPCDRVSARRLIGAKVVRQRVLTDAEIKAVWRAANRSGAFGKLTQLLLVTGQRKSDVAEAPWSEFDDKLWTVSEERFKSDVSHEVPLSSLALDIIKSLPRDDDRLFRVRSFSREKRRLDVLMLRIGTTH
jgi:hypothetical protein